MSKGYKMFVVRGLYIKAKPDMTFKDFLKSSLLKTLVKERKDGIDRFKQEELEVEQPK